MPRTPAHAPLTPDTSVLADTLTADWETLVSAIAQTRADAALKYGRTINAGRKAAAVDYPALVWSTMSDDDRADTFAAWGPAALSALTFGASLSDLRANILTGPTPVVPDAPDAPTRTPRRSPVRPTYVPTPDATPADLFSMALTMTTRSGTDDAALSHDRAIRDAYRADAARGGYPREIVKGGPRQTQHRRPVKVTVATPDGPVTWWRVPVNGPMNVPAGAIRSERDTAAHQTSLMGTVSLVRPVDPTDADLFEAAIKAGEKATAGRGMAYVDLLMSEEMYAAWLTRSTMSDADQAAERMRQARKKKTQAEKDADREKDRVRKAAKRASEKAEKALMAAAYVAAVADAAAPRA